jgi:ATP-binding cassette subfamily C (CFTR/MRP) protein 1
MPDDLWELDEKRKSENIAPILERNFFARCPPHKRPRHLREGQDIARSETISDEKLEEGQNDQTPEDVAASKKVYDESLVFAMEKTFRRQFWIGGILQLIGGMRTLAPYESLLTIVRADALSTTSPLVTKALLQFLVDAYLSHQYPTLYPKSPPIGKGIGLAFGLYAMQQGASIAHNHALSNSMTVGLLIRSTVRFFTRLLAPSDALFRLSRKCLGSPCDCQDV